MSLRIIEITARTKAIFFVALALPFVSSETLAGGRGNRQNSAPQYKGQNRKEKAQKIGHYVRKQNHVDKKAAKEIHLAQVPVPQDLGPCFTSSPPGGEPPLLNLGTSLQAVSQAPQSDPATVSVTNEAEESETPYTLNEISDVIHELQTGLQKKFGINKIYIGGGSSRAILDHVFDGKPLKMRDLDLFVVAGRPVTKEFAASVGQALESGSLGKYSSINLRPRLRGNPKLPKPEAFSYNSGYGFYWEKDSRVVDISMFHTEDDLALNGVSDIDKIMISVDSDHTLPRIRSKYFYPGTFKKSYKRLLSKGIVIDKSHGYANWRKKKLHVENFFSIAGAPVMFSIRLLRGLNKIGAETFPPEVVGPLKELVANGNDSERLQIARNFIKLLEDKNAAQEIKALQEIGAISKWSPALDQAISKLSRQDLEHLFSNIRPMPLSRATAWGNAKLKLLVDFLPESEKISIYQDISPVEPELASLWKQEAVHTILQTSANLNPSKELLNSLISSTDKSIPTAFDTEVSQIDKSPSLEQSEKRDLLVRSILRRIPVSEREATLESLIPHLERAETERLLGFAKTTRRGFITGVFNPLHYGHVDILTASIQNAVLDELTIIPTPATGHNEKPVEWEHRIEMANRALKKNPKIKVADLTMKEDLLKGTGNALYKLVDQHPEDFWIHLMGEDSAGRYFAGNAPNVWFSKPNRQTWVADRAGEKTELHVNPSHASHVKTFNPQGTGPKTSEEQRASSMVRKNLAQGKPIDKLVPLEVEAYIKTNGLYLSK